MNNGASQPHPPVLPLRESSHIPIHEVKRKLHIGGLSSFLLWLSKTDYYVLSLCPTTTRNTLASLGMMVIFTTLLAFASSLYTLKTAVVPPDAALSWPISAVLAVVYAFGILIIDREIVGATSSRALFIRFFFAALIATAVSYPVKLLFFEGRIVNEIDQMLEEEHAPKLERIEHLRSTIDKERWEQREGVRSQIDAIDTDIQILDEEIKREGDIVNCGTKCQALLAQKKEMMEERLGLVERLEDLAATGKLPKPILEEINALEAEMKARRDAAYDFLYKAAALDRIAEEVGATLPVALLVHTGVLLPARNRAAGIEVGPGQDGISLLHRSAHADQQSENHFLGESLHQVDAGPRGRPDGPGEGADRRYGHHCHGHGGRIGGAATTEADRRVGGGARAERWRSPRPGSD